MSRRSGAGAGLLAVLGVAVVFAGVGTTRTSRRGAARRGAARRGAAQSIRSIRYHTAIVGHMHAGVHA